MHFYSITPLNPYERRFDCLIIHCVLAINSIEFIEKLITTTTCCVCVLRRFVSNEQKKAEGAKRDNEVLLQRQKPGEATVPYRIIDNPTKLTPDDWFVTKYCRPYVDLSLASN